MKFRTRKGDVFTAYFDELGSVIMTFLKTKSIQTIDQEFFNELMGAGEIRAMPQKIPAAGERKPPPL